MGCSNSINTANVEQDFFTGPIEESIKARQALKRAKIKEKEEKIQKAKEEEEKKQQEEEQKRIEQKKQLNLKQQKERAEEIKLAKKLEKRKGPVSFFDVLAQKIPKMDFGKVLSNKESSSDNKSEENIKEATETESSKDEKELDIDSSIRTDENIHNVVQPSNSQNEKESSSNDINDYEESSKPKAKKRKAKEVKYKQQIIPQQSYISHIIELEKIFVLNPSPLIIIVIGSEESGKTALLKKYIKKEFVYAHTPTESISIFEGKNYFNKGKKVPLCFVDTPPIHHQNNFLIVQDQILKSHIIIYMLDISEEDPLFTLHLSLLNIQFYKKQIIAVIGNKEDKIPSNEIIKRGIKEYCSFKGYLCSFYSCLKYKHDSVKHLIDKKIIKKYFDMYN